MLPFATSALLILLLLLPGLVVVRLSGALFGESEWWRRAFAATCLYPLVIWAVLMLLAPFGLMKLWPVLAAMAILAGATVLLPRIRWRRGQLDPEGPGPGWQIALAAGTSSAAFVYFLIHLYFDGTTYLSDDYAYHGPTLAAWFQSGTLDHPRIMFPSYYPFNSHLITFYTLLPTGDLRWTWVATMYWVLLGAAALPALMLSMPRFRLAWGLLAVSLYFACSEISWFHFHTLCPTDVIGTVLLLSAFACAVPREGARPRESIARVALSAMLIGFAIGTKMNYAPAGVVASFGILIMSVLANRGPGFMVRFLTTTGVIAVGAFVTGSYWYLWNWIHAKNPVFPARVLNFRGPGNEKAWGDTTLKYFIEQSPGDIAMWREIAWQALDWPHVLGFIALVGLVIALWHSVRLLIACVHQRSPVPLAHPLPWMLLAGLVMLIQYPFLPYSGTYIGGSELIVSRRYFFFLFLVGLVMAPWGISRLVSERPHSRIVRLLHPAAFIALILVVLWCFPWTMHTPFALLFGVVFAGAIMWSLKTGEPLRLPSGGLVRPIGTVVLALILVFAGGVRGQLLPGPYMTTADFPQAQALLPAIDALDRLPPGSRIGQYTLNSWEYWYLCGSRFQHRPVILWETGEAMIPLHDAYYGRLLDVGYPRLGVPHQDRLPNPETFAGNLRAVPLDYLFISRYVTGIDDDDWPLQRPIVREMPEFRLIWTDGYSEIYRRVESP